MPAVSLLHLLHATTDIYKFHWAPSSENPPLKFKSSSLTHFSQYLSSLHPQSPFGLVLWSSLVFIFIFLSLYYTLSSNSHLCSHAHMQMHILLPPSQLLLQCPVPSPNWVLEDLSKPRGRKSTFLPHQLAKPNVEKAWLKALLLLMLTAIGKAPFA